jgi:hypothetical protein
MWRMKLTLVAAISVTLAVTGCGSDNRLLSIQVVPIDPNLTTNNIVYIAPAGAAQYEIIGWYSNRNSQTITSSQGKWSSSNTTIATVDANGLVTSVGPVGATTIAVTVSGHTATSYLSVCDPLVSFCPP